jgi:DNA-directed RNA polymerase specialized sigma24 family protein
MNSNEDVRTVTGMRISPHLDVLLAISMGMTHNGRDATRLIRESVAEAFQTQSESVEEENTRIWLQEILTKRYFNGFMRRARPFPALPGPENVEDDPRPEQPIPTTIIIPPQNAFTPTESSEHLRFYNAVHHLPEIFRPAVTLSYLEGVTTKEIADMVSVQPHKITALLHQGCTLIRNELHALLLGNRGTGSLGSRSAESA